MGDVLTTLDHLFIPLVLNVSTVYSSQYPLLPATAISPCVIPVSGCAIYIVFRLNDTAAPMAHYVLFSHLTVMFSRYFIQNYLVHI